MTYSCWFKERQDKNSIQDNMYQGLLDALDNCLTMEAQDEMEFDIIEVINCNQVDLPPFPKRYAQKYFELEQKILKKKFEHIMIPAVRKTCE